MNHEHDTFIKNGNFVVKDVYDVNGRTYVICNNKDSKIKQLMYISVVFVMLSVPVCLIHLIATLPKLAKSFEANVSSKIKTLSINSDSICNTMEKLASSMEKVPEEKKARILKSFSKLSKELKPYISEISEPSHEI